MASNGHKNFNFSHNFNTNIPVKTTVVPVPSPPSCGIPCLKSNIESKTGKFVWEINGISSIVKHKLWRVPNCQFSVGPYKWRLSLNVGAKGNILYANPDLINPMDATASYFLRLSVVNAQNYVLHSPQFLPDHPLFYDGRCKDSFSQHGSTWEVLRFSDGFVDLFSNYVIQDSLKIMVEMTVYINRNE